MPFDNTTYKPLDRTRLAELSYALRNPLPEGFTWDMGYVYEDAQAYRIEARRDPEGHRCLPEGWCGSVGCAIGLAMVMYPDFMAIAGGHIYNYGRLKTFIDMPEEVAQDVFFDSGRYGGDFDAIRPKQVADAIDEYLSGTKPMEADSRR